MSEIQVNDSNFDAEVMKSAQPVMVDFWAPWCGPCRMLAPVVEELAKDYQGKVKVCKCNTDESPNMASLFRISAIPTVMFFKNGKAVGQTVGLQSKAELKKNIDSLL